MIGSAAKAYLFLLRVRAVYGNSKLVTLFVGLGWFVVVCMRMTVAYMIDSSVSPTRPTNSKTLPSAYSQTRDQPMEQTGRCAVTSLGPLPIFSIWLNMAYDTCIFISISVRLTSHAKPITTPWIPSFVRGYGLPYTMRHILQDGQIYYLCVAILVTPFCGFGLNFPSITVFFTLLAAIIAVLPVSPIYQASFPLPGVVMEMIMTCKVFRAMILRPLHSVQNVNVSAAPVEASTTAMTTFEFDTVLEHRIRTMNIEYDH